MGAASRAAITSIWGLGLHGDSWGGRVVMRGVGEGAGPFLPAQ